MTDKERIAEWRGWTLAELKDIPGRMQWRDSEDVLVCHENAFQPATQIEDWHGPDGLLAEILKRGPRPWGRFVEGLLYTMNPGTVVGVGAWSIRQAAATGLLATPAQLTAALIKMIEEASNEPEE